MPKISQLSSASTLTGSESLLMLQGGRNVRAGVGVTQVLHAVGDPRRNIAIGTMDYVIDAPGGPRPMYWDGTSWKDFTGRPVNFIGNGIWVVGVSPSTGPAHDVERLDTGFYFWSADGFVWHKNLCLLDRGFRNISYANGCFIATGRIGADGFITTTTDPRNPDDWNAVPPQAQNTGSGTVPDRPTAYDNQTGQFTVSIIPSGTAQINNPLFGALIPDKTWPHIGENAGGGPVIGMGEQGPVEVQLSVRQIVIPRDFFLRPSDDLSGNAPSIPVAPGPYSTVFIESRKVNAAAWNGVVRVVGPASQRFFAMGEDYAVAGLSLRGLVWGPIKATAVQFLGGSN